MREMTYILIKEINSWSIQDQLTKNMVVIGSTKREVVAKFFSFDSSTNYGIYCLLDKNGKLVKKRTFRNKMEIIKLKKDNKKNSLGGQIISIDDFLRSVSI
jgi:hypothetical protein